VLYLFSKEETCVGRANSHQKNIRRTSIREEALGGRSMLQGKGAYGRESDHPWPGICRRKSIAGILAPSVLGEREENYHDQGPLLSELQASTTQQGTPSSQGTCLNHERRRFLFLSEKKRCRARGGKKAPFEKRSLAFTVDTIGRGGGKLNPSRQDILGISNRRKFPILQLLETWGGGISGEPDQRLLRRKKKVGGRSVLQSVGSSARDGRNILGEKEKEKVQGCLLVGRVPLEKVGSDKSRFQPAKGGGDPRW